MPPMDGPLIPAGADGARIRGSSMERIWSLGVSGFNMLRSSGGGMGAKIWGLSGAAPAGAAIVTGGGVGPVGPLTGVAATGDGARGTEGVGRGPAARADVTACGARVRGPSLERISDGVLPRSATDIGGMSTSGSEMGPGPPS